jgi:peroxiredoxin
MKIKTCHPINIWLVAFYVTLSYNSMNIFPTSIQGRESKVEQSKPKLLKKLLDKGINKDILKSDFTILLFFDPLKTSHKTKLYYANILQNKYQSKGLRIIGISVKSEKITNNLKDYWNYSLEIISDSTKDIHSEFGFQKCCGGTVFIDKKGKTVFVENRLVDEEVLRQLTEKYLLGKVNYILHGPQERILFKENSSLPMLTFRREWNNEKIGTGDLIKNRTVLTFFSSMCSTCKTGRRIDTLTKIKEIFNDRKLNVTILLVFSLPFDENDIESWEQEIKIPFSRVFCYSDIYSEEEKYIADISMRLDPMTVVIDTNTDVIFIEQFGMSEEELIEKIKKLNVFSK